MDVKRELSELENMQTDLLRLVEGVYAQSGAVEGGREAQEEFIKGELGVLKADLLGDLEDALVRQREEEEVGADAGAGSALAAMAQQQLEDRLAEIRSVAEKNQASLQDMQDALYSSAGRLEQERSSQASLGDPDQILDEMRVVSRSVEALVDSLDALQGLPSAVEDLKEDVRDASSISAAGDMVTNKQEVVTNNNMINLTMGDLEKKIDDLARATELFEKVSGQLSVLKSTEIEAEAVPEERGALPEAGSLPTVEESLEEDGSEPSEGDQADPSWLELDKDHESLLPDPRHPRHHKLHPAPLSHLAVAPDWQC